MVPDRKARLLLVSSQASPPSSQVSFQKPTANLTDSIVSGLFKTTVLPSASTSCPPQDHKNGYHQPGASPRVCPAVWPMGRPLALSFLPASSNASQVSGKVLYPISSNHDLREATSPPTIAHGTPIHLLPTVATSLETS